MESELDHKWHLVELGMEYALVLAIEFSPKKYGMQNIPSEYDTWLGVCEVDVLLT